jgi:hypothetical protein
MLYVLIITAIIDVIPKKMVAASFTVDLDKPLVFQVS